MSVEDQFAAPDIGNVSPEEQDALDRLAQVPAELVSDALRAEVSRAAQAVALRRAVEMGAQAATISRDKALAVGDGATAASLEAIRLGAVSLDAILPPVELDQSIVDETFRAGGRYLLQAWQSIPDVPPVQFTLEMAAWRSLGAQQKFDPPLGTRHDLEMQSLVDEGRTARSQTENAITAWIKASGQMDLINALIAVGYHVADCETHTTTALALASAVEKVNQERADTGMSWRPPDSYSTPEIERLRQHAARKEAEHA